MYLDPDHRRDERIGIRFSIYEMDEINSFLERQAGPVERATMMREIILAHVRRDSAVAHNSGRVIPLRPDIKFRLH